MQKSLIAGTSDVGARWRRHARERKQWDCWELHEMAGNAVCCVACRVRSNPNTERGASLTHDAPTDPDAAVDPPAWLPLLDGRALEVDCERQRLPRRVGRLLDESHGVGALARIAREHEDRRPRT